MLRKLLKQDIQATGRLMLPMYAIVAALAIVTRLAVFLSDRLAAADSVRLVVGSVTGTFFVLSMLVMSVLTFVVMVWRFYKNFLTDEGYLMFTLPVKTWELIVSKLLTAMLWSFCTLVMFGLAAGIHSIGMDRELAADLQSAFEADMIPFTLQQLRGLVVLTFVTAIFAEASSCLMCYASMAMGQSARKHKFLVSVLCYFGIQALLQIVSTTLLTTALIGNEDKLDALFFSMEPSGDMLFSLYTKGLLAIIVIAAVLSAVFYIITHQLLKKSLNLQ